MQARHMINSALVAVALATAACGGGRRATGPSGPAPSTGGSNQTPPPSSNLGTLEVSNPTSVTIYFIKVRACGTTDFGSDLLLDPNDGVGGLLSTSETGHWQLAPGCSDVQLSPSNTLLYVYAKQIRSNIKIQAGKKISIAASDWQPSVPAP